MVLKKDLPSPFLRESDEEKGEAEHSPTPKGEGASRRKGRARSRSTSTGLDQRILSFPLPPGNYASLQAGAAGQIFYLAAPKQAKAAAVAAAAVAAAATLMRYDLDRRRSSTVQAGVIGYELTPDGRKMLYATGGGNWFIASTRRQRGRRRRPARARRGGGRAGRRLRPPRRPSGDGKLNLDAIEVRVDPRAEWKQIFDEAWRINRDFFYDPNMHGADWPAMKKKYEPFLPHVTNSGDLYRVIRWMLSELAVGHSYTTPGERLHERKTGPRRPARGRLRGRQRPLPVQEDLRRAELDAGTAVAADRAGREREGGRVPARGPRQRPEAADRGVLAVREHGRQVDRDHRRPERRTARAAAR